MQTNPGIQNVGLIAWNGEESFPRQVNKFRTFGFVFEIQYGVNVLTDAVFRIEAAHPSEMDPCEPGEWFDVPEVSICSRPAQPGPQSTVTIPAGTVGGSVCSGALHCMPAEFIRLVAVSGDTHIIKAVLILQGPII